MLKWGPIKTWTQRDFQNLNQLIFEKTHEQISVSTLKRILGKVEYQGLPYQHTLDIICKFLGIKDWVEFTRPLESSAKNEIQVSIREETLAGFPRLQKNQDKNGRLTWKLWLISFFIASAASLSWYFYHSNSETEKTIQLKGFLITSNNIADSTPHQVNFEYSLPKEAISMQNIISFGEKEGVALLSSDTSGKGRISHTYYRIGHYSIKIFSNKILLAKSNVLISNSSWAAFCLQGNFEKWIEPKIGKGFLRLSGAEIANNGLDTSRPIWTSFELYKTFEDLGDDFVVEGRIRNPPNTHNHFLPKVQFKLTFENERCFITLDTSDSVKDIYCKFGEFTVPVADQKANFRRSIGNWSTLKMEVINKNVKVYLNGKQLYNCAYKTPLGKLNGLEFRFRGLGEIDELKIVNLNKELIYHEVF